VPPVPRLHNPLCPGLAPKLFHKAESNVRLKDSNKKTLRLPQLELQPPVLRRRWIYLPRAVSWQNLRLTYRMRGKGRRRRQQQAGAWAGRRIHTPSP
ncbi:unnamed protein product, partial [Ectocarpus sp. 12 AP-2014]